MASQRKHKGRLHLSTGAPTYTTVETSRRVLKGWPGRRADRKRRVLVQWLRRTANRAHDPGPIRRRREALLHYRTAAVRTDLLEIAAALERTRDPDPACIATLHELLANGCDSPLYNPDIHASELRANPALRARRTPGARLTRPSEAYGGRCTSSPSAHTKAVRRSRAC